MSLWLVEGMNLNECDSYTLPSVAYIAYTVEPVLLYFALTLLYPPTTRKNALKIVIEIFMILGVLL
ncbi:hypothetical protein LIPSTDRAFT_226534 [Lipomyces starkeyi NRRL Y-11557]|uniref:Uncharacterized protein n=1 Tax=Lipomyces starkeyi NRRL Y-11557 TaxID=675824 RepID=A0A1E3PU29_LIPST|nr:hypothetical protein LIPSTDRAFT_226534 [Lipomyces starkeyi NRRL Y-11557]